MIDSGKMIDGKAVAYEVVENGYNIYLGGRLWISQPAPYDKLYVPSGTYEENALAQIETLITVEDEKVE